MFGEAPKSCDATGEVIDEEGEVRFYRCVREPGHSGGWHTGWEFGPKLDLSPQAIENRKMQIWPVGPARQQADRG